MGALPMRLGYVTPEEATWTCETCGIVQPRLITAINRYMRGACACQRAEQERIRASQEQFKQRQEVAEYRRATYGWLGSRWSDEGLADKTFATFAVLRQSAAYEAVLAFLDVLSGALILYGPYGTGKTHLLAALCQEAHTRGVRARFTTAPKLFSAIQARIKADEDYTDLISKAIAVPLLVIDDVDKAKWSEFREEVYFEIIDSRVNAHRPIALSTNRLDALSSFIGGACASRLLIGQMAVPMKGEDYRKELELWA